MPTSRKWMLVALAISVGINLALAGFMAGRVIEPRFVPPRLDPALAFFPAVRQLPEARRDVLRPIMRAEFGSARPNMRRMIAAQRAINDALTAEPYSENALAAALAEFRGALLASQEDSHAALVRLAGALTQDERNLLAGAMRHGPRAGFSRSGGPGPGMHGPDVHGRDVRIQVPLPPPEAQPE
jgi:uncharacterized membrane protein